MFKFKNVVQDKITGFRGVVIAKCEYLYEETSYYIQPQLNAKEDYKSAVWLDESRLELIYEDSEIFFTIPSQEKTSSKTSQLIPLVSKSTPESIVS